MKTFNGHKNWNHWNVFLWINNDEKLYRLARECVNRADNRAQAAQSMLDYMDELNITQTPDGAPYSITSIRAAMVGM